MLSSHSIEIAQTKYEVSCKVLHSRKVVLSRACILPCLCQRSQQCLGPSAANCDKRRWTCNLHAAWAVLVERINKPRQARAVLARRGLWSWDDGLHRKLSSCLKTNCKKRNNSRQSAIFITMPVVESQLKREKNLCRFSFSKISGFVWLWGPKLNSFGNR